MPKPNFRDKREERKPDGWKTREAVTPEPVFPSTTEQTEPTKADEKPVEQEPKEEARTDTRTRTSTHARTHARKQVDTQAQQEKRRNQIETLYRQLQSKKHLSSYTFRYRPEELDELESVFTQIERDNPGKVSRNDIARLALNALLEDYRANGDTSTLAQVLTRM